MTADDSFFQWKIPLKNWFIMHQHYNTWNSIAKEKYSLSRLYTILYHQNKYLKFSSANFTLNFTSAPAAQSCPLFIHTNKHMWRGRKEPQVKYSTATWHKSHPNINPLNNPCQNPHNTHTLLPFLSISKEIRSFFFQNWICQWWTGLHSDKRVEFLDGCIQDRPTRAKE